MKNREYNYLFKVVLVGNSNVGKSSIVLRFADGEFNESYITTIGVDFRFKSIEFDGKKVKLQIWDTAGQERFRTITSSYYKGKQWSNAGAHALLITFDITSRTSFADATKYWYAEIRNQCPPETDVLLVGNKSDLDDRREVTKEEVAAWSEANNVEYIETSAKECENIEEAFIRLSKMLIRREEVREAEKQRLKERRGKKQQPQDE